jgi:hypothetical protein
MSSMVTPDAVARAVTSSPGEASAKPSTSKPQATFDTVAGAKAVTASMGPRFYPTGYGSRVTGYGLRAADLKCKAQDHEPFTSRGPLLYCS